MLRRPGWRILLFLGLFLIFAVLGSFAALPGIAGATLPLLAAALVAGWLVLRLDGKRPAALGFHLSRAAPVEAAAGLALGVAVATVTILLIVVAGGLRWNTGPGSVGALFVAAGGSLWLFAIPAAAEEALFRGYPFQALAAWWGAGWALAATSAGFALLHYWNPNVTGLGMMNILGAGVFLGALYLRTASLWWASGAHLGWNWAHGFLFAVPVSGLELVEVPFIEAVPAGPAWISGGSFGPEGSVFAVVAFFGAAALIWRPGRVRPEMFGRGALSEPPLWMEGSRSMAKVGEVQE